MIFPRVAPAAFSPATAAALVLSCLLAHAAPTGNARAQGPESPPSPPSPASPASPAIAPAPGFPPLVQEKCSGCHQVPRPGSMPRRAWGEVVDNMVKFMVEKGIPFTDQEKHFVTSYYLTNSPVKLPDIPDDYGPGVLAFEKRSIGLPSRDIRPVVSNVRFVDLDGDGKENEILVCDDVSSSVSWLRQVGGFWTETALATISSPVEALPVDVSGNGLPDLAVSAMGIASPPNDELIGEFHILYNEGNGTFVPRKILEGAPRIASAAPADYDGDGDIDFVLAMFGWRATGGISLLENRGDGKFALRSKPILEINGAMQVIPNDADGDGRPDFVAMISQQHESIVQFLNQGDGNFRSRVLARARHPAFGSSSIHLADLDGDGDEDILYTNGDMMDETPSPKPYHGLQWLENRGGGRYELHLLARMPGCYCAVPTDLDGDGDLDVVFSALYFDWKDHDFPSLAWLENVSGDMGTIVPRKIAYSPSNLARIDAGDADGDGLPDIVGGGMHVPGSLERAGRITLWLGRGDPGRPR